MAWGDLQAAWSWPRQLVAAPPNVVTPQAFGRPPRLEIAGTMAWSLKVLDAPTVKALRLALIWACPRGSRAGREVHPSTLPARWTGPDRRLVLIGKGVTFDSGGYNLQDRWLPDRDDEVRHGRQCRRAPEPPGPSPSSKPDGWWRARDRGRPAKKHGFMREPSHPGDILTASNGKDRSK